MVKSVICLLVLCVAFVLFFGELAEAQTAKSPASIGAVSGTVVVKRAPGKLEAAKILMPLNDGDTVQATATGSALILFANGRNANVAQGSEFVIKAAETQGEENSKGGLLASAGNYFGVQSSKKELFGAAGAIRPVTSTQELYFQMPINTFIREATPVISWDKVKDALKYEITISTTKGIFLKENLKDGSSLDLAAMGKPLNYGTTYLLTVKAETLGGGHQESKGWICLPPLEKIKEVNDALNVLGSYNLPLSTQDLLAAQYLESVAFRLDAYSLFQKVAKEDPQAAVAKEQISRIENDIKDSQWSF